MVKFLKNDFNKVENYKKKNFIFKNEKIINNITLKSYLKKINKSKKKRKIFSDIFFLLKRIESISSVFPRIYKLKLLKKIKKNKKKIIKIKGHFLIETNLNSKFSLNFVNILFVKYYYLYLNFIFRSKHKYIYFEELLKPVFKKNILLNKKNLIFKFNFYIRWVDFSRKFVKLKKVRKLIGFSNYKLKRRMVSIKKLRFLKMLINIKSNFILYFFNFLNLIIANYYKIIIFLYKKFRKKKLKL